MATDTITVVYNCQWSIKTQHLDVVTSFATIFRCWLSTTGHASAVLRPHAHGGAGATGGCARYVYTEAHRSGKFSVNHIYN